jgi:hypothetical protein
MRWFAAAAALMLLEASSISAQTTLPVEEGNRVRIYQTGENVARLTGRLLTVLPDSIRLAVPDRPSGVWIDTAAIRIVELRMPLESRKKHTLIGGLVGAAAGLGLALAIDGYQGACPTGGLCNGDDTSPTLYVATIGTGTGVGALLGYLLSGSHWQAVWVR